MEELVGKAAAHAAGRLLSKVDAGSGSGSTGKKSRILKLDEMGRGSVSGMFGVTVVNASVQGEHVQKKPQTMNSVNTVSNAKQTRESKQTKGRVSKPSGRLQIKHGL